MYKIEITKQIKGLKDYQLKFKFDKYVNEFYYNQINDDNNYISSEDLDYDELDRLINYYDPSSDEYDLLVKSMKDFKEEIKKQDILEKGLCTIDLLNKN